MLTLWAPKQTQSGIGLSVLRNVSATPLEVYHILTTCVNLEVAGFVCLKLVYDPRGFDTNDEFEKLADIDSSLKEVMFKNFRPVFPSPKKSSFLFSRNSSSSIGCAGTPAGMIVRNGLSTSSRTALRL
jgi:hypothetical protein